MPNDTSRRNGALSRGPLSTRGKAISARNATRHGLTANKIVLPAESQSTYRALYKSFLDTFQPRTPVETELVQTMAIARWRLRRLTTIEANMLSNQLNMSASHIKDDIQDPDPDERLAWVFKYLANNSPSLGLLIRYESTLTRAYDRAFKQLRELRNEPNFLPDPPEQVSPAQPD